MKWNKLVIFDADGTLSPQRDGACGEFSYTLMPNVREKCAALRADGVQLAIASNQSKMRPNETVRYQMAWTAGAIGLGQMTMIMWANNPLRKKPHPFMLEHLVMLAGVAPEHALFVGDRDTDRQAAEAAGVDFQWAWEFFGWEEA